MEVFSVMGGAVALLLVVYVAILAFPLIYVVARWRSGGEGDPGLGTYAGARYLRSVAVLIAATGASLLLYSLLSKRDMEETARIAAGLLGGSLLFFLAHLVVAERLRDIRVRGEEAARRTVTGFLLLVTGLMALASILFLCVVLVRERREGADDEDIRAAASFALVWTFLYVGVLATMLRRRPAAPRKRPPPPAATREDPPL